ncbi:MAG: Hint domain-containing protein [Pseudomonadota bacterium]
MFDWWRDTNETEEEIGVLDGMLITTQSGFLSGTMVATRSGWRAVDQITVGEEVLTFDHGFQIVTDIQRNLIGDTPVDKACSDRVIEIPTGALGNARPVLLMPDQGILVENEETVDVMGDPFAVVAAALLEGCGEIQMARPFGPIQVTVLAFEEDEVVYIDGGLLAHCPRPRCILTDPLATKETLYHVLSPAEALNVVSALGDSSGSAERFLHEPGELLAAV